MGAMRRAALLIVLGPLAACSGRADARKISCVTHPSQVGIGATFHLCPEIASVQADPVEVRVGGDARLEAMVNAPDGGMDLTDSWTSSLGTVAAPSALTTTYRCTEPGFVELTLTVSDGQCGDSSSVVVRCVP